MGHMRISEHHPKQTNIVAQIESIIHDQHRLGAFVHEARASLRQTGLLPHNRIWDYMHWRRDLAPARFDHYHPEFAGLFRWEQRDIERMQHHQPTTGVLSGFGVISGTITPSVHTLKNPPLVVAGGVPEPGTLTLGLAAIAVGAASVAARWARKSLAHPSGRR